MILTALSFLARLGVLAASVIVLGLGATFIQNRAWNADFLIYIEVLAALSVLGSLVPPYPNFLYDLLWALAWAVASIFALIIQFFESDCYGFRSNGKINCATYKAGTAFAFLCMFAWLASAFFGGLRILAVIFDVRSFTNRPLYIGEGDRSQEELETDPKSKGKELDGKIEAVLPEEETKKKKKKKVKGFENSHVASYFICYGILGVVLLAAGIPLLFIYAAPAFGRYMIDRTPIPDVNVTLENPTNDSIAFSIVTNVRVPDTLKVSIDPMHVEFFLEDTQPDITPIVTVDLPKLTFSSNEKLQLVDQTLKLGNLDEFARLIEQVAYKPTFRIAGRARTKVRIPPIPTTWIDIFKVAELPAFNNFPQIDIKRFGVQPPDADGYNVVGEVDVVNPSPASVTLGDVTLVVLVGDVQLGRAFVAVNDIVPGNNSFFVKGMVDIGNVEDNINSIIITEVPYLKQGLIMASASGESVVYQGQHLQYWEKAFQTIKVSATRPVKPLLMSAVDNSLGSVMGVSDYDGFVGNVVSSLVDTVLKTINDLPADGVEKYADSLTSVAKLVLRILTLLGFI
ncbi:hypothetical protein AJ79_00729 [Helicocarpus griseus UAMH5409]|uniref:MARVEL domain-containing protein n=1 Tax=Helicocarpus griseus UAMH5409 TaxID=1447875 RepID=A0A2B7YAL6_9EURO|nr:hypothetical protein AJ79_00729 [Helicocarpus griseus UAMH5409]